MKPDWVVGVCVCVCGGGGVQNMTEESWVREGMEPDWVVGVRGVGDGCPNYEERWVGEWSLIGWWGWGLWWWWWWPRSVEDQAENLVAW